MPSRRIFLGSLAASACAAGADPFGDSATPADSADDAPLDPITPNASFYQVAISGYVPDAASLAAWTLTLADEDGNRVTLTPDEVAELGGRQEERTLSCIGGVSYRTVGNAVWTSIRLDELLAAVGLDPDPRLQWVRFTSGDGYTTSVPRSDLAAGLSLAWAMNGEPLPPEHGAPFRVLVPGRYGMKNPKWLTQVELVEELEPGFWEAKGWSQDAEYQVMAFFVSPFAGAGVTDQGVWLKGVAFAGEAGISRVELSHDDGATWTEAEITYPGAPGVWTLWRHQWFPPASGAWHVLVRAIAADGRTQTASEGWDTDLDGLEAYDSLLLTAI